MAKQLFQDIVPPEKRSIKKVPVPDRGRRSVPLKRSASRVKEPSPVSNPTSKHIPVDYSNDEPLEYSPDVETTDIVAEQRQEIRKISAARNGSTNISGPLPNTPQRIPFYQEYQQPRRIPWKSLLVLVCAIAIVGGTYVVLSHFAKATITLTPKTETVTLNNQFTADLFGTTTAALPGQIQYQVVTAVKDGSMEVASTGDTAVQTKATGSIVIYNDYSSSPQKLVAMTRFETTSGLIYRITAPVTVPGKQGSAPGSVVATVTADQPGENYNVGLSDFTIPGFSGTSLYKGFYARAKTPMTGGATGTMPKIDPASLETAQATIDAELESSLLNEVKETTPAGYILPTNAWILTDAHEPSADASSSQAVVNEEGTIQAFVFNAAQLASQIALNNSQTSPGITWQIPEPSDLNFSVASSTAALFTGQTLTFNLTGTTTMIATIDVNAVKNALEGKSKGSFDSILASFSSVATAQMTIQPFWQMYFPTNPANITVATNY